MLMQIQFSILYVFPCWAPYLKSLCYVSAWSAGFCSLESALGPGNFASMLGFNLGTGHFVSALGGVLEGLRWAMGESLLLVRMGASRNFPEPF